MWIYVDTPLAAQTHEAYSAVTSEHAAGGSGAGACVRVIAAETSQHPGSLPSPSITVARQLTFVGHGAKRRNEWTCGASRRFLGTAHLLLRSIRLEL